MVAMVAVTVVAMVATTVVAMAAISALAMVSDGSFKRRRQAVAKIASGVFIRPACAMAEGIPCARNSAASGLWASC